LKDFFSELYSFIKKNLFRFVGDFRIFSVERKTTKKLFRFIHVKVKL